MTDALAPQNEDEKHYALLFEGIAGNDNKSAPEPSSPGPGENDDERPYRQMFDDIAGVEQPKETSTGQALGLGAGMGAIPAAGSLAGAGAGAQAGFIGGGLVGGPVGAAVGAFAGGVAGGFGGGYLAGEAQQAAIDRLPADWKDPLLNKVAKAQKEHPYASFIGGLVPFALTMSPYAAAGKVSEGATALDRLMANPTTARLFSGGIAGGLQIGQDILQEGHADWAKDGIATGFGFFFPGMNQVGKKITSVGERPFQPAVDRVAAGFPQPEPETARSMGGALFSPREMAIDTRDTINEARDLGTIGPGATEETAAGREAQTDAAKIDAMNARMAELPPFKPSIDHLARKQSPEIFDQWDALTKERDSIRSQIRNLLEPPEEATAELKTRRDALQNRLLTTPITGAGRNKPEARRIRAEMRDLDRQIASHDERRAAWAAGEAQGTPEITGLRKHLTEIDMEMRDLSPQIRAAHRRAHESLNGHTPEDMAALEKELSAEKTPAVNPEIEGKVEVAPEEVAKAEESVPADKHAEWERIAVDMTERLEKAGRPKEVAQSWGEVFAARMVSLSDMFSGKIGSPFALYEKEAPDFLWKTTGRVAKIAAEPKVKEYDSGKVSKPERPVSLLEFLATKGLEPSEELKQVFDKSNPRKIVRKGGLSLDKALEAATEAGYFHEAEEGERVHTPADLLDLIRAEQHGQKQYAHDKSAAVNAYKADKEFADYRRDMNAARKDVLKSLPLGGHEDEFVETQAGKEVLDRAADYLRTGEETEPYEAWNRSVGEYENGQTDKPWQAPADWEREFFQKNSDVAGYYGSYTPGRGDIRPLIKFMEKADASTVVHEFGHYFLDQLSRYSSHPDAPPQLRDDFTTLMDWLKVKDPDRIERAAHEKFARGFERYMMEGRAPSSKLARAFENFKNWMQGIYDGLRRRLNVKINDDVRAVFDRMFTTAGDIRPVIGEEAHPHGPTLPELHRVDAELTEPHEAGPMADRIVGEMGRHWEDTPEDVRGPVPHPELTGQAGTEEAESIANGGSARGEGGASGSAGAQSAKAAGQVRSGTGNVVKGGGKAAPETSGLGSGASGRGQPDPIAEVAPRPTFEMGEPNRLSTLDNLIREVAGDNEEAKANLDQILKETDDLNKARRGYLSWDEISARIMKDGQGTEGLLKSLARVMGLSEYDGSVHHVGMAYNAEQIYALGKTISALNETIGKASQAGDVISYEKNRQLRRAMIEHFVGARAEAGRSLGIFNRLIKEMGNISPEDPEALELFQKITGRQFGRAKVEAKLAGTFTKEEQIAGFLKDSDKPSFGRMLLSYYINNLISGFVTHWTYMVANMMRMGAKIGPQTIVSAGVGRVAQAMGREGPRVQAGEIGPSLQGFKEGVVPAVEAAVKSLRTGATVSLPGEAQKDIFGNVSNPNLQFNPTGVGFEMNPHATLGTIGAEGAGFVKGIFDAIGAMRPLMESGVMNEPWFQAQWRPEGSIPNVKVMGATVPLGPVLEFPGRGVAAFHSFLRVLSYSVEKNALAYRQAANEGHTGEMLARRYAELSAHPTEEMMKTAHEESLVAALMQNEGKNGFLAKISKAVNHEFEIPGLGTAAYAKFIVPFMHISSNILTEAFLKSSPAGAILSPTIRADLLGKNGSIAQDKTAGAMLFGSASIAAFMALKGMGQITGSPPDDPREKADWSRLGLQPYSVRIGDHWYSYKRLGPLALVIGSSADLYDAYAHYKDTGETSKAAGMLLQGVAHNFLDESFMRGPSDLLKALEDPESKGAQYYINHELAAFAPFSVFQGQFARSVDPYMRQADGLLETLKANTPYVSESLRPKLDLWGDPIPSRTGLWGSAIWEIEMNDDRLAREMHRIGYFPAPQYKTIKGVELTPEQQDEYHTIAGHMARERMNTLLNADIWPQLQDWQKRDLLRENMKGAMNTASGAMMSKYPDIVQKAMELKRVNHSNESVKYHTEYLED